MSATQELNHDNVQNYKPEMKGLQLERVYLKDLSFEAPNTPLAAPSETPPQIDFQLNISGRGLDQVHHEVTLSITVTAKIEERVLFLIEVQHAGIFTIAAELSEEQRQLIVSTTCPTILFPYTREVISETISKGGFLPFYLPWVDFDHIYFDYLSRQNGATASADSAGEA